jgi:hypothetical protein
LPEAQPEARPACPLVERALQKEMSRRNQALTAFWVLIVVLLGWQFYQYNQELSRPAADGSDSRKHYFFLQTNGGANPAAPAAPAEAAIIKQRTFDVQKDEPNPSMFTCVVTVKNVGNAKATGIQVEVRPYKDASTGDEDVGGLGSIAPMAPTDPRQQISQWVTFPDLAPGESATEKAVFVAQQNCNPGKNPDPQITFQSEKPRR